jgi:hypothetical protein
LSWKEVQHFKGVEEIHTSTFTNRRAKEIKLPKLYIAISDKEQTTTSVGLGMNTPTFTN